MVLIVHGTIASLHQLLKNRPANIMPPPKETDANYLNRLHQVALSKGGRCLTLSIENKRQKCDLECAQGHLWTVRPDAILDNGGWCRQCVKDKDGKAFYQTLVDFAEKMGGRILSKAYITAKTPLLYECGKGHQWECTPDNTLRCNSWCKRCASKRPKLKEYESITWADVKRAKSCGARTRALRIKNGMTFDSFKRQFKLPDALRQERENCPTTRYVLCFSQVFGVHVHWLTTGIGPMRRLGLQLSREEEALLDKIRLADAGQQQQYSDYVLKHRRPLYPSFDRLAGSRVRAQREALKLSQEQLAKESGCSQATIMTLEHGTHRTCKYIAQIAYALDSSPEWVVWGHGVANNNRVRMTQEEIQMMYAVRTLTKRRRELLSELISGGSAAVILS
ncbi:MAG: hypothetical protein COA42_19535 [Alteromonadaceae bacterium]|nr:MAG: hypothetical protein COA42_19535 [Alteromonadaceae bacterium]